MSLYNDKGDDDCGDVEENNVDDNENDDDGDGNDDNVVAGDSSGSVGCGGCDDDNFCQSIAYTCRSMFERSRK